MTATVGVKVDCPVCGGPVGLARSGRLLWHFPWRVGKGGRKYQSATGGLCTGEVSGGAR